MIWQRRDVQQQQAGFSLLEVLVALTVFAVIATTFLAQSQHSTRAIAQMRDKSYAIWISSNRAHEWQMGLDHHQQAHSNIRFGHQEWRVQAELNAQSETLLIEVASALQPEYVVYRLHASAKPWVSVQ